MTGDSQRQRPVGDVRILRPAEPREYDAMTFDVDQLADDPIAQWDRWYREAVAAEVPEPNAFTLATVDEHGDPDARIVLARQVDARGFVFFTSYESPKSRQLAVRPVAAAVFSWVELHRQVRLRGNVSRLVADESDVYFETRPRGHQISAWASPQSELLADRAALDALVAATEHRFQGHEVIPRPDHWGGWRFEPSAIEFWQGQPDRRHDRLRYLRDRAGGWTVDRLAP